ncbi:MAG: peptidoglycan-binding protein [Cyanobacteria bacterium]|nr:peptidoglycan-binding protein [Cyanobacteriota bacterium]
MQNTLQSPHQRFQTCSEHHLLVGRQAATWTRVGFTCLLTVNLLSAYSIASSLTGYSAAAYVDADGYTGQVAVTSSSLTMAQASSITRRTLRVGNQGEDVRELQAALKLLGYFTGAIDGIFGAQTEAAVRRFQSAAGTDSDGIVGAATWSKLFPAATMFSSSPSPPPPASNPEFPTLRRGSRGEAVERLQQRLRARGFLQSFPDGVFGPNTEAAVKAAQRRYGLEPDGIVGPATWDALSR